jgi:phage tail sheath protein FI
MAVPIVGISTRREAFEPAPPSYAMMSVVGLCCHAEPADGVVVNDFNAAFPLNTPVIFNSTSAKARMIHPDSYVGKALALLNAQVSRMQRGCRVVFTRVAEGDDDDETAANIAGDSVARTGMWSFASAGSAVGAYPRLVCIPGPYASQIKVGVTGYSITSGGDGYDSAPSLALPGGVGDGTGFAATAVLTGDVVTGVTISNRGDGYDHGTYNLVLTGGTPDEAASIEVTIGVILNPIVADLPGLLNSYLGFAVVQAPHNGTMQTDQDFRETIQSERIMVCTPDILVDDSEGDEVNTNFAAAVIGLFVRRDFDGEGRPFNSVLNQPVYGVVAPARTIDFSLTDGATDGQVLLSQQIGCLVRGETGDDFAIADGGFVYLGFETCSEDLIFRHAHAVRGRDFIELTIIRTLRTYLGRKRLNVQGIQSIIDTIDNIISPAVAKGEVAGKLVRFDPDENNRDDLRTGHIYADVKFEPTPVLRRVTVLSRPYGVALDRTIEQLITAQTLL